MNRHLDRFRGYLFICRMYGRPLLITPIKLSEILAMAWRGDESFDRYLKSIGLEFLPDAPRMQVTRPSRFSELKGFAREHFTLPEPTSRVLRKIKRKANK